MGTTCLGGRDLRHARFTVSAGTFWNWIAAPSRRRRQPEM